MLFSILRAPIHLALFSFCLFSPSLLSFSLLLLPKLPPSRDCLLSQLCRGCEMRTGIRNKCHCLGACLCCSSRAAQISTSSIKSESVFVLGERGNNAYTRGVIARNSFVSCPWHPASQGVSLDCLSCQRTGTRVSCMVRRANSHSASV